MSAAARGAAGAMVVRRNRNRRGRVPHDAALQTERYLSRFVSADRARELAAEAIAKRRRP